MEKIRKLFISVLVISITSLLAINIVNALSYDNDIAPARNRATLIKDDPSVKREVPAEYSTFALAKNSSEAVEYSGYADVPDSVITAWGGWWSNSGASIRGHASLAIPSIKGNFSALYKKVGVYDNQLIDVKATVVDFETDNNSISTPAINLHERQIGNSTIGIKWVKIKYEFFISDTQTPISVKGNTSYWDIDWYQGIIVDNNNTGIYIAETPENLLYLDEVSEAPFIFEKNGEIDNINSPQYGFTETFSGTSVTRTYVYVDVRSVAYDIRDGGTITNDALPVIPIEPPAPTKKVSQKDITNIVKEDKTYQYTIDQIVPNSIEANYYKSFVMTDTLEDVLTGTNIVVKNEAGTDVTSWFTTNINGQTVTATAKASTLSNANFYGHTYSFIIDAKVKSGLTDNNLKNYRDGTVYKVPNDATVTIDDDAKHTGKVNVYWYRGMCQGGNCSDKDNPEPDLPPVKTVSTGYVNDITTFDYRVSQYVPEYNSDYLWNSLSLTDTIDNAFDMNHTTVKVIDTRYGNKDVSTGNDRYFDITVNNHTITATATTSALTQEAFYGTTYELVITTKVTDGFDFTGYEQTTDANGETVYTIINNQASRTFEDKNGNSYGATTKKVPTTHVNPKMPTKEVDAEMIRAENEYNYTITKEIAPATSDNYYNSFVFTDNLEAPLQIKDASKVKITQIDSTGKQTNYTDKFDIKIEGNKVTATLKNPKEEDFYGTRDANDQELVKTYKFTLTVSLREDAENKMDMSKYIDETGVRYVIPNTGSFTITNRDNNKKEEKTNEVRVYYYPDPVPVKTVSEENITEKFKNNDTYTYSIKKHILKYDDNAWYDSFEFIDTLEECLEATNNLEIKNEAGVVVTNWFDIKVDGQTISAKLKKENNNQNFYGHTYTYTITTKVKKGYVLKKWETNGQYIIPNEAEFVINNNVRLKSNKQQVYINTTEEKIVNVPITSANIPLYIALTGSVLVLISIGIPMYKKYGKDKIKLPWSKEK